MAQSLSKRTSNRPETGRDLTMAIRFPTKLRGAVVKWAEKQPDTPQIPAAVRRLVELGLAADQVAAGSKTTRRARNTDQQARASEMAGRVIDNMIDDATANEDKVSRKRRLIKGPDEFQKLRTDRQKPRKH
jgi:soluble lytic murein transglycosylase-like protein